METYDFSPNNGAYSPIQSFLEITEATLGVNDAPEIIIMDDDQFELPPYDVMMDRFDQQFGNSLQNGMWAPQYSAFNAYIDAHSNTAVDSLVSSQTLHKRCFRFLRKIDEDRKLEIQRSCLPQESLMAPSNTRKKNQAKTAFHHMIAERNRRVKLTQHFNNLYSLLPRSCKKDKHSILSNTTSYLRELKLRVCELEQQSESVEESIQRNFRNTEGGNGGFESHDKPFFNSESSLLYRSDDVILEQCEDFPCQVKIIINVQRRIVSCPPSLLIKVIELLRAEQLEILSFSHINGFRFQAIFIVLPKGEDWDISQWQSFGSLVSGTLN
ncbi:hypothetical protein SUGI_0442900 [Cryptomeria japonica]|nr:hypothetical protein SUGI_0442900 [Cryptomeria japonica]